MSRVIGYWRRSHALGARDGGFFGHFGNIGNQFQAAETPARFS